MLVNTFNAVATSIGYSNINIFEHKITQVIVYC